MITKKKWSLHWVMVGILTILLFQGFVGVTSIYAATTPTPTAGFLDRRDQILNYFATTPLDMTQTGTGPYRIGRTGFWGAEASFLSGNDAQALTYVQAALNDATSEGTNAGFSMWPGIDCYMRWNSKFSQSLKDQFKSIYTTFTGYNGGVTPNQKFMLATARDLAAQVWGTSAFVSGTEWGGTSDPTGSTYITSVVDAIPYEGLIESDARIYSVFTFGPMTSIADLSTNLTLANHAQLATEWTIARASSAWLSGHWAAPPARAFITDVQTQYISGEFPYWLFFGGSQPEDFLDSVISVIFCRPGYGVSGVFENIANDRTSAYTTRMMNYRHELPDRGDIGYYKTVFMNKNNYALYSTIENTDVKNADNTYTVTSTDTPALYDPHQMQRWGIEWNDPTPGNNSLLFVTNPYDPNYAYVGTTNYEDVVQNNGTLVAVYNIPTTSTKPDWVHGGVAMPNYQELWGSVPAGYQAFIDNSSVGRIYFYYNNVMISLYISRGYTWNDGMTTFTLPANKEGLVVETALPSDYSGATPLDKLTSFKNDILAKSVVDTTGLSNTTPSMTYTDRNGVKLEITYGGTRKIDGTTVDFTNWPLIDSTWIHQSMGGPLTAAYGGTSRTYNFSNWTTVDNATAVNDTDPSITYSSGWNSSTNRNLGDFSNDVHYTSGVGNSATFAFTGKTIEYITERNTDEGNVDVYMDGVLDKTVNCYSSTRLSEQTVYSKTWATSGAHTIKIVLNSGHYALLDGFRTY